MQEDNFLSSWLREGGKDKKERQMEVDKENKGETGKKRIREEEKEENQTVIVKRKCVDFTSAEVFDILSQGEAWGKLRQFLGVTCGVVLVACRTVVLGLGRVCLWLL